MLNRKLALLATGVCTTTLVACVQSDGTEFENADIANVTKLKSSFGPELKVS